VPYRLKKGKNNDKRLQKKTVANLSVSYKAKSAFDLYADGGGDPFRREPKKAV
jgi:hypothetical protein